MGRRGALYSTGLEIKKVPMVKKIIAEFQVIGISKDKSKLVYSMAYKMPFGKLMKGKIRKNVKNNAYATKHYIETGDAITAKNPKKLKKLYY